MYKRQTNSIWQQRIIFGDNLNQDADTRTFKGILPLRYYRGICGYRRFLDSESRCVYLVKTGRQSAWSLHFRHILTAMINKLLAGDRHDMPPPLYAARCGPAPAHTRLMLGLRRPARLASSSCGRHEYSRCTRQTSSDRRQTDARRQTVSLLNAPAYGRGHNNTVTFYTHSSFSFICLISVTEIPKYITVIRPGPNYHFR